MKTKILLLIFALGVAAPQVEAQGLLLKVLTKTLEKKGKLVRQDPNKQSSTTTLQPPQENSSSTPSTSTTATPTNKNDEVTLVVSADGTSKEEATKVALRSAIEQAYGTFVSANTTLLNDELVKDEIVTVSSGNIKEYKEIASNVMPDGKTFVTLQATVCISKLVNYAQSKGAETEFAGATFAMNMKMKELNKRNEKKALDNLLVQIKELAPYAFTWNIYVQEPKLLNGELPLILRQWMRTSYSDDNREQLKQYFHDKRNIGYYKNYMSTEEEFNTNAAIEVLANTQNCYEVTFKIQASQTNNAFNLASLIISTLNSLALSEEERKEYERLNIPRSALIDIDGVRSKNEYIWSLRSSEEDIKDFEQELNRIICKAYGNFNVVDNLGVKSYCYSSEISQSEAGIEIKFPAIQITDSYNRMVGNIVHGTELFQYALMKTSGIDMFDFLKGGAGSFSIIVVMPESDISKYSSFRVERR